MLDLSSRAVLVSCEVNMYRTNRVDKEVTSKINDEYQTKRKAGSFTKITMAREYVRGYESAATDIKNYHKLMTLPWDPVNRILAIDLHQEYMDGQRQRISIFEERYCQFCINYSSYVHAERESLGPMWKAEDYPAVSKIRDLFGIKLNIVPIPSVGDWRVKLSQEEIDYLNENLEKQIVARFTSAMTSAWKKLYDPIKNMADRLSDDDKKPHNSIVENIKELLPILPRLNINNDPKLDEMVREVEERLCEFSGKEIRESKDVRSTLRDATAEIMKKMAPYAGVNV